MTKNKPSLDKLKDSLSQIKAQNEKQEKAKQWQKILNRNKKTLTQEEKEQKQQAWEKIAKRQGLYRTKKQSIREKQQTQDKERQRQRQLEPDF